MVCLYSDARGVLGQLLSALSNSSIWICFPHPRMMLLLNRPSLHALYHSLDGSFAPTFDTATLPV